MLSTLPSTPIQTSTYHGRNAGRSISHLIFEFDEKKPPEPEKPKRKTKPKVCVIEPVKLEKIDHYAETRKRFGDKIPAGAIPPEIIEQLKAQGRW